MSDNEDFDCQPNGKPPGEDPETQLKLFKTYFDTKLDSLKREIITETQFSESNKNRKAE